MLPDNSSTLGQSVDVWAGHEFSQLVIELQREEGLSFRDAHNRALSVFCEGIEYAARYDNDAVRLRELALGSAALEAIKRIGDAS